MHLLDDHIQKIISAVRPDILNISELTSLVDIRFDQTLYPEVLKQLCSGKTTDLPEKPLANNSFGEYLYVYTFRDSNRISYLATFYDNDALEQDAQAIDILEWEIIS